MRSVCRQALKLPDSLPVSPELRGKNWVQGLVGEGSWGEAQGPCLCSPARSPEGFLQGPWHLRRGPEAWGGATAEARGPPQPAPGGKDPWETCSRGAPSAHVLTCRSPSPAGCVPQSTCCSHSPRRMSSCKGQCLAGWRGAGAPCHSAWFPRALLVPPRASWLADHIAGGGGGNESECSHSLTGAQSSCCHLAHSLVPPVTSRWPRGWGLGPWEAAVRHE